MNIWGQRFAEIRSFVAHCGDLNVQTDQRELEHYEKTRAMLPVARVVYPDEYIYERDRSLWGSDMDWDGTDQWPALGQLSESIGPFPFGKVPASIIPEREMLAFLLELSSYQAWCCGFANRKADGTLVRTTRNFHLDHIDPKSKDGSNQITNRAPLCPHHNIRKNNRPVALREYRQEIADAGEMMVDSANALISLAEAYQRALDRYAMAVAGRS